MRVFIFCGGTVSLIIGCAIGCSSSSSSQDGESSLDASSQDVSTDAVVNDSAQTILNDGSAIADAGSFVDGCSATTGVAAPLSTCSAASPCTVLTKSVVTATDVPSCATSATSSRPSYTDSLVSPDDAGAHYECEHGPTVASTPLVVFFHGAQDSADTIYDSTSLRTKAVSTNAADQISPTIQGFALVSVQGRNLHWPTSNPSGSHHDYFYRDLDAPSTNPDIANADRVIDDLVASGKIDTNRIFVSGWSNGAFFAQLYAIARHEHATPGGNRIAAAAVYAGGDPFIAPSDALASCGIAMPPHSSVPILMIHRSCDAYVPCDAAQQAIFKTPNGDVTDWLARAKASSGVDDPNISEVIIDNNGAQTAACAATSVCDNTMGGGVLNHARWPDGVADEGGVDWERGAMLPFFSTHHL